MRSSLKLLAAATVFLLSSPVEAVVIENSSVTNNPSVAKSVVNEEVKIAQVEGKKQRRDGALRLNELGMQQLRRGEYREALIKEMGDKAGESVYLNNIGNFPLRVAFTNHDKQ